jgi:hypothetical protein
MINKPISGFVAETEHFSHTGKKRAPIRSLTMGALTTQKLN